MNSWLKHKIFKDNLSKVIYNDLFWLLLLSFTFRNIIQNAFGGTVHYNSDSATYWLAAQSILKGVVDEYRTPLYPIVLKLIENFGIDNIFEHTILFQQIVSFISIIPFYIVCKRWFAFKTIAFVAALVYACHPWILLFNNGIFAESLLVSFLVFFLYFFSSFISQPSTYKWISLNVYVFILVMLKPLCIIFCGIMIVVGFLFFTPINKKFRVQLTLKQFFLGFSVNALLLLGFCAINNKQNDFFGISTVSHDNNFANIILSNSYESISDKKLVSIIDTVKEKGYYYTIYYLNNDHEKFWNSFAAFPPQYSLSPDMIAVKMIPTNDLGYNREKLAPIVRSAMCNNVYINYIAKDFIAFSNRIIFSFKGYLIYMILLLNVVLLILEIIFRKEFPWIRIVVLVTATSILFACIAGGISDSTRERVLIPIIPLIIYLFFDSMNILCRAAIDKLKLRKVNESDKKENTSKINQL